ncbi:zinc finger protein [Macleaya cordata]|uniref:Zinc finger protein n=1 Tax=Macleaya cordata TaxID=56857 RepID=A0A200Q2P1_MACCD|nr:zinc finger protein [Macleaya cordata]
MDANNDWKTQADQASREKLVNKLFEHFQRSVSISCPEQLDEIKEAAARYEERVYNRATSWMGYLRKISLKLMNVEADAQRLQSNPTDATTSNGNPSDGGSTQTPVLPVTGKQKADELGKQKADELEQPVSKKVTQTPVLPVTGKQKADELEQPVSKKVRLFGVEICDFVEKSGQQDGKLVCSLCLDCLKETDEIRELPKCFHKFHKGCFDAWVDRGKFICPYCGSFF